MLLFISQNIISSFLLQNHCSLKVKKLNSSDFKCQEEMTNLDLAFKVMEDLSKARQVFGFHFSPFLCVCHLIQSSLRSYSGFWLERLGKI